MDALTPAGRLFGPWGHERRSDPGRSPCFSRAYFQPFCSQPLHHPSPAIWVRSPFSLLGTASQSTRMLLGSEGGFSSIGVGRGFAQHSQSRRVV